MPRIDEIQRTDRKTTILDAAERCFMRSGFHGATMAEICGEAGMSPGNLYRYFPSKEAMIEGLCERDLAQASEGFDALATSDDLWASFRDLAYYHMVDEPRANCSMWIEIMSEATRNPQIAALRVKTDEFIYQKLYGALDTARSRGHTEPHADLERTVQFMITYADGLMLRRGRDPDFDPVPHVEMMFDIMRTMLLTPLSPSNDNLT
ncbi:TetR/AcrR family transcriptional regulator [Phreatobacter stygius]|uniref:TetR/AcrR family transcriptional regulator n=1 Tax=Phreatobacter stygius TaxID=1940610 RepID=A0A4D7AU69_9HYPH|nr:TetR/AcrR family transcriptional regulator [Phreatobacter stygius]QCI64429.1 TetR/AcrR family transcriptional regulator [Phreatobacter stygius]